MVPVGVGQEVEEVESEGDFGLSDLPVLRLARLRQVFAEPSNAVGQWSIGCRRMQEGPNPANDVSGRRFAGQPLSKKVFSELLESAFPVEVEICHARGGTQGACHVVRVAGNDRSVVWRNVTTLVANGGHSSWRPRNPRFPWIPRIAAGGPTRPLAWLSCPPDLPDSAARCVRKDTRINNLLSKLTR